MLKARLLLVDDDAGVRFGVGQYLRTYGYELVEAGSVADALSALRNEPADLAILDYRLPDGDALELVPKLRELDAELPCVVLTGHGSIQLAVQAIKVGAEQFLTKPVELSALKVLIDRLVEQRRVRRKLASKRGGAEAPDPFRGDSTPMHALKEAAQRVAKTDRPVLIQGETGSGKGLLAAWLHHASDRAAEGFVNLNCAGLSRELLESELFGHERGAFTGAVAAKPGLMEIAHRGILFLDEIGDLDLALQAKLLKVLEEQRFRRVGGVQDRGVDVRLITATHHRLPQLVREGGFRSDLYFRISTLVLEVPALRARREDIPALANELLIRLAQEIGRPKFQLTDAAVEALCAYAWPGNVRELRNVLERAALLSSGMRLDRSALHFDMAESAAPTTESSLEAMERQHIANVLRDSAGKVTLAAERLGIPRSTLYEKLKRHGLASS
ncbi:MAG: sigma-54-dependent transcriptional regulator [Gammaproteobacteria bacterium]